MKWSLVEVLAPIGLGLSLSACVATSIREDIRDLRELTAQSSLAPGGEDLEMVTSGDVSQGTAARVTELLAQPIDPASAAQIAILNHRELRSAIRELGVARGELVQASTLPNPTLEFDLRYQEDRSQPLQGDLALELNLTETLLTPLREAGAANALAAARFRVANDILLHGFEARRATLRAIASNARLRLAMRTLEAFAASREAARTLYQAGNIPLLEAAAQEAAYEAARADAAMIELDALESREAFLRALGLSGDQTEVVLSADLPQVTRDIDDSFPAADTFENEIVERSLAMRESRARLESHRLLAGLERSRGALPDVHIDGHGQLDGNTLEIGGGARFGIPIFDQRRGATAAHEAAFDAELEHLQSIAVDLRSTARSVRNRNLSFLRRARAYRETILPARRTVYEQTLLQYNAMQVSVQRLLDAMRAVFDAELSLIDQELSFWEAQLALELLRAGGSLTLDQASGGAGSAMRPSTTGGGSH